MLVENGEVESLVSRPDPIVAELVYIFADVEVVAELVYIFADVEEFPIIWCIRSNTYQVGQTFNNESFPIYGIFHSLPHLLFNRSWDTLSRSSHW